MAMLGIGAGMRADTRTYCPVHNVRYGNASPIEKLDEYKGRKGYFIKKFLISDKVNKRGWQVLWEGILKFVGGFVGKPVVVTEEGDHPPVEAQDNYKIGQILDLEFRDRVHEVWAVEEITDKKAQDDIDAGRLKFGSPAIQFYETDREITREGHERIHVWIAGHDCMVKHPAYGPVDRIKAVCKGGKEGCLAKLSQVADVGADNIHQGTVVDFAAPCEKKKKAIGRLSLTVASVRLQRAAAREFKGDLTKDSGYAVIDGYPGIWRSVIGRRVFLRISEHGIVESGRDAFKRSFPKRDFETERGKRGRKPKDTPKAKPKGKPKLKEAPKPKEKPKAEPKGKEKPKGKVDWTKDRTYYSNTKLITEKHEKVRGPGIRRTILGKVVQLAVRKDGSIEDPLEAYLRHADPYAGDPRYPHQRTTKEVKDILRKYVKIDLKRSWVNDETSKPKKPQKPAGLLEVKEGYDSWADRDKATKQFKSPGKIDIGPYMREGKVAIVAQAWNNLPEKVRAITPKFQLETKSSTTLGFCYTDGRSFAVTSSLLDGPYDASIIRGVVYHEAAHMEFHMVWDKEKRDRWHAIMERLGGVSLYVDTFGKSKVSGRVANSRRNITHYNQTIEFATTDIADAKAELKRTDLPEWKRKYNEDIIPRRQKLISESQKKLKVARRVVEITKQLRSNEQHSELISIRSGEAQAHGVNWEAFHIVNEIYEKEFGGSMGATKATRWAGLSLRLLALRVASNP